MALSLLRCGATLIGTTRFVHDCLNRFMQEKDYDVWRDRVHLYALDLRDLWMVEQFCSFITQKFKALFAIVNNAAQTIARTVDYTASLRFFESQPIPEVRASLLAKEDAVEWMSFFARHASLLVGHPLRLEYHPIANGGGGNAPRAIGSGAASDQPSPQQQPPAAAGDDDDMTLQLRRSLPKPQYDRYDLAAEASDHRTKNSWTTNLSDVEGSEAAEVMAINAMAPLIINARLRPMLEARDAATGQAPEGHAQNAGPDAERRFIINVSAMEGQFYRFKQTTHPHTNMAKAALNMMTRTSGADYVTTGIFMNSVDTGWITDETPDSKRQRQWTGEHPLCPLDEIDAAARCLDLIYVNSAEFGKFYKDYREIPW